MRANEVRQLVRALDEIARQVSNSLVQRNAGSTPLGIDVADTERGRRSFHHLLLPVLLRLYRRDELE